MSKALLVIDVQNDYFEEGAFPLWHASATMERVEAAVRAAQDKGVHVIHVQHVADPTQGPSPFFNEGTPGVDIHARILAAAPEAPVVVKSWADAFHETTLEDTLSNVGVTDLLVCGMMTQNCVTHTAISKGAEKYNVTVLADCCTTVSEMIHLIALHALSSRCAIGALSDAI